MRPFTAFNFSIEITPDGDVVPLCGAAFSECDGLEMSLDMKSIREGGNNGVQVRLAGPATYGQLTLKRGMTTGFDLWRWFERTIREPQTRASGEVVVLAQDGSTEQAVFTLTRCLPVKLKAPPLNAREGVVAVEELQVAYESLRIRMEDGNG